MERKRIMMLILAIAFLIGVGVIAYDMASHTTSPWNKKKFEEKYQVK